MKSLVDYLNIYWKTEKNWKFFALIFLFLSFCISLNYSLDFETSILKTYKRKPIYLLFVFLYYSVPYYFASWAYQITYKNATFLYKRKFWLISGAGLFLLAISECSYLHYTFLEVRFEGIELWFLKKIAGNISDFLILFSGISALWYYLDRKKMPLYGFSTHHFESKPYLIMILVMLPFITWASFQPDFLSNYPTYKDYGTSAKWGIDEVWNVVFYEFSYGLQFVTVEFFFRGFMILALAETIGTAAIVPIATLYCVFHFGKPVAETISSFFGGTVLGIFAYYSRSIYGGVSIHLTIAYLMELTAYLQK